MTKNGASGDVVTAEAPSLSTAMIAVRFGDLRLPARFWVKIRVDPVTGCWVWIGYRRPGGYGQFHVGSELDGSDRAVDVHRHAYLTLVGPVPEGLELDHVKARGCVGPACVNPAHLEPVTHAENMRRGAGGKFWRAKTHCPQGHPYDDINTERRYGRRYCGACREARALARRNSARAAGVCVNCGRPAEGHLRCAECRSQQAAEQRKRERKRPSDDEQPDSGS
jgi:hypothetical protein